MTNEKVIERLKKGGCGISVSSAHEMALVFNACYDANATFYSGLKVSEWPRDQNPMAIFINDLKITCLDRYNDDWSLFGENEENITDWFFKNVNGDDMENNVYVAAGKYELPESEKNIKYCNSYPTIELAIQDIIDKQLTDYPFCEIEVDNKVISIRGIEIKPKQTPLPIPDWFWKKIDKELTKAAIDSDLESITFYPDAANPYIEGGHWITDNQPYYTYVSPSLIGVPLKDIDWRLSLTKRPEGL